MKCVNRSLKKFIKPDREYVYAAALWWRDSDVDNALLEHSTSDMLFKMYYHDYIVVDKELLTMLSLRVDVKLLFRYTLPVQFVLDYFEWYMRTHNQAILPTTLAHDVLFGIDNCISINPERNEANYWIENNPVLRKYRNELTAIIPF